MGMFEDVDVKMMMDDLGPASPFVLRAATTRITLTAKWDRGVR